MINVFHYILCDRNLKSTFHKNHIIFPFKKQSYILLLEITENMEMSSN